MAIDNKQQRQERLENKDQTDMQPPKNMSGSTGQNVCAAAFAMFTLQAALARQNFESTRRTSNDRLQAAAR